MKKNRMSILQIKKEFDNISEYQWNDFIQEYTDDDRSGVQAFLDNIRNRQSRLADERKRLEAMRLFEKKYPGMLVCGIDEVGRGPLAGPVVTGAVILPEDCEILYINDSKKLTEKKREELSDEIMEKAISAEIGIVTNDVVDEEGINNAVFTAMRDSVNKLSSRPDVLLVDAVHIPDIDIAQIGIVKGDSKSVSIAAASIIAKVYRDRLMVEYDKLYPEYHFASNKGYGSAEHIAAIRKYGLCPLHRRSFTGNFV